MTPRHHLRRFVLAAAAAVVVVAATLSPAVAAGSPTVVLRDIVSDANGLNDGAEGFAQGFQTSQNIDEADLHTVAVAPLRNAAGRTTGYRLAITTTGRPGQIRANGTPLRYQVVLQLTSDCRIGVTYTGGDGASLVSSCGDEGLFGPSSPLRWRIRGEQLVIDVPYRVGPGAMHRGQRVERTEAYVNAVLVKGAHPVTVLSSAIDTRSTYARWTLPR